MWRGEGLCERERERGGGGGGGGGWERERGVKVVVVSNSVRAMAELIDIMF